MKHLFPLAVILAFGLFTGSVPAARAQGTAFTYQGRLNNNGLPANGSYDLQFALFATNTTGSPLVGPVTNTAVAVTNGLFITMVDFGSVFAGTSNWLQIAVSTNGANDFNPLLPRQQLSPAPYAITAANVSGTVPATQLTGTIPNSLLAGFQGSDSAIGGGLGNAINGSESVIAGGYYNTNNANQSAIAGGSGNLIQPGAYYSFIGSGGGNVIQASAYDSAIASGYHNLIGSNSIVASIGGGQNNAIATNTDFATIGGGYGNTNAGAYATIPGGYENLATGSYSLAAGHLAQATNAGTFVWADSQATPFASTNNDSFNVRAQGGVQFVTSGAGLQVDGSAVLTAAPGSIQGYEINDGGGAAYQTFQTAVQALGGDTTISFANLSPVSATNGSSPALTLTINGAAFGSVVGFSGSEGMSQPYSYVVEVANSTSLTASGLTAEIGKTGALTFSRNGRATTFSGIVTTCAQAAAAPSSYLYTVQITSPLARLALNTDYKIHQNSNAPAVASMIYAADGNTSPAQSLEESYTNHLSLTEYGETDLNFFNRILEREGIFYFFDQNGSLPALILGDNPGAYLSAPNSPFAYYGNSHTNTGAGGEYIRTFQQTLYRTAAESTVNSSDFLHPENNALASVTGASPEVGQYYEYGNDVATASYDQQLATARQDLQTAGQNLIAGSSTAPDLRAGYTFSLTDQSATGLGGTYLVTTVHHAGFVRVTNGVSTYFYANQFQVLPAGLTFRPPLQTPKPQALSTTATVTGPAGEEIWTDKYGRVKVLFHWDRYGADNDTSSAWIPVASPWAGAGRGFYFVPRMGDNVMVTFIGGDPDQPVITGSFFNADHPWPYTLPENQTYTGIKTLSSKGGGGYNEMRFGDTTGSEEIYLHAQNDFIWDVLHDLNLTVDHDLNITADSGSMSVKAASLTLDSTNILTTGNFTVGGTLEGSGSGLTNLPAFAALLNGGQTFTGTNLFTTNLAVIGTQAGGFGTPLVLMQNTNSGNTAPTLRLSGSGNSANGVLSVSSLGTGLIAQFGNASSFVANITTNGTVNATGFNGEALRVGSLGTTFATIQAGQAIMPSSNLVATNFTVNFPQSFPAPPKVIATLSGDTNFPDVSDTFAMSIRAITNRTSFTINVVRVDQPSGWSQQLRINWQAWQ